MKILCLLAVIAAVGAECPAVPEFGCEICGEGRCIGNLDAIVTLDALGAPIRCDALQNAALSGELPSTISCESLPSIVTACGCGDIGVPATTVPAPTPGQCPQISEGGCSVCGEGKCVQNPKALLSSVPCGDIENAGYAGLLDDFCHGFPGLEEICECDVPPPVDPTPAPAPVEPIQETPTVPPALTCNEVPPIGCSICGEGLCVQNGDAAFSATGYPDTDCITLEASAALGLYNPDQCEELNGLVDVCECGVPGQPGPSPTPAQCPETPEGGCSVCGEGRCVQNPDVMFTAPLSEPVACIHVENAGFAGLLNDACDELPEFDELCGCGVPGLVEPTPAPIEPVQETPTLPPALTCPEVPPGGCSICGDGLCVQNGDATFSAPGYTDNNCLALQAGAALGIYTPKQCEELRGLVGVCECDVPRQPEPSPAPSPAPGQCPEVSENGCSICGDGKCVQNRDAMFSSPGFDPVLCIDIEEAGSAGMLSLFCGAVPRLAELCECGVPATAEPTPAPIQPTPAPIESTPAPIESTLSPIESTLAPIEPTNAPSESPVGTVTPTVVPPPRCDELISLEGFAPKLELRTTTQVSDKLTGQGLVTIEATLTGLGWIGIGWSADGKMNPGISVIGNDIEVRKWDMFAYFTDMSGLKPLPPIKQTLMGSSFVQNETHSVLRFTKFLREDNEQALDTSGDNTFLWAYGIENTFGYHGPEHRGSGLVNLEPCSGGIFSIRPSTVGQPSPTAPPTSASLPAAPLEGDNFPRVETANTQISLQQGLWTAHGVFAALAWAVFAPIAIAAAMLRYRLPAGGTEWFKIHFYSNMMVAALTIISFFLAVAAHQHGTPRGTNPKHFSGLAHRGIGLAIMIFVVIQVLAGVFRVPGPRQRLDGSLEVKSLKRHIWEWGHRILGLVLLITCWVQCTEGFRLYAAKFASYNLSPVFWCFTGFLILGTLSVYAWDKWLQQAFVDFDEKYLLGGHGAEKRDGASDHSSSEAKQLLNVTKEISFDTHDEEQQYVERNKRELIDGTQHTQIGQTQHTHDSKDASLPEAIVEAAPSFDVSLPEAIVEATPDTPQTASEPPLLPEAIAEATPDTPQPAPEPPLLPEAIVEATLDTPQTAPEPEAIVEATPDTPQTAPPEPPLLPEAVAEATPDTPQTAPDPPSLVDTPQPAPNSPLPEAIVEAAPHTPRTAPDPPSLADTPQTAPSSPSVLEAISEPAPYTSTPLTAPMSPSSP